MRIGIVTQPEAFPDDTANAFAGRLVTLGRKVEALGFAGLWVTDSFGRGRPTLDPLISLGVLSGVTERIELGTGVLQVPLRDPVELAHRVHSLDVLSGGRLRLGIGPGSTRDDFEVVGGDYDQRFKVLPGLLDQMRRVWRGEAVRRKPLQIWPGTEGRPHVLLGAWRNRSWIKLAAQSCEGWIASGIHSSWEDLEAGIRAYREAGGKRALLANVFTDFRPDPVTTPIMQHAKVSLLCTPQVARERLQRVKQLGFDDVTLFCPRGEAGLQQLETIRGLI